jgi:hypothetical protein
MKRGGPGWRSRLGEVAWGLVVGSSSARLSGGFDGGPGSGGSLGGLRSASEGLVTSGGSAGGLGSKEWEGGLIMSEGWNSGVSDEKLGSMRLSG